MERLPFELQRQILDLLTNQDKLTCLLVSKKHWNRIAKPHLFNYIMIENDLNLSKAILYFEKYPELANTVFSLEIQNCQTVLLYLHQIQQLFPNLKGLYCLSDTELPLGYHPENIFASGVWSNLYKFHTGELYTETNTTMTELVLSNPCPKLKNLILQVYYAQHEYDTKLLDTRFASIFNLLQNAPQLSQLRIITFYGTLSFLENIHQNAPNLTSLQILDLAVAENNRFVEPHEPVQLAKLCIEFNQPENEDVVCFYKYIAKKYTGLESFEATFCNETDSDMVYEYNIAELDNILLPLFARCPQLTSYNQMFSALTPTIVHEMDRCDIHLENIELYINQQTVGSQCVALGTSEQRRSIKDVTLNLQDFSPESGAADETLDICLLPRALMSLANLSNLTSLTISSTDTNECYFKQFPEFLSNMPHLEKLFILGMVLDRDTPAGLLTNLSLKSIEIRKLSKVSSTCLSLTLCMLNLLQHCPDLEEFQLGRPDDDEILHSHLTFDFTKNLKLKSIEIDLKEDTSQYHIMRFDSFEKKHYLHDTVNNSWMERDYTRTNEYFTMIMLSQPVLLNSHQV